ncbi:MAG: TolC family protein [Cyclobacteriaceae bacterium]|nr:TolC family protein [Cyclobacteriaceae bacterium]MBX2955061.1 TolC family protein [Cyclobacteriaceae bacterium]
MKYSLVTIIFISCAASSFAQLQLTYNEALTIALQKNVDFNIQQNEVERASAQRLQSIMDMAPSLRASADFFDRRGRQQIQNPETNQVEFLDVVSENIDARISASLPLFGGLNRIQTLRASQSNMQAQTYSVERTKQTTIFNVSQQYLQVLLSEELYRIAQDNHRNQSENLKRIEGLVEVGALAIVDKYNQLAEVKRLESLMIRAWSGYESDKLILAQTLQLEPGTEFKLVNPGISIESVLTLEIDLDALYQTALTSRPDYNQQKQVVLRNTRTVSAFRGNYFPTVSAFYTYGSFYNSRIPFSLNEQMRTVNPYHFYGFSLSVPILTGFATRTQVQSAKIDRDNSLLQENNLKTIIYRDVKTAYQNFEAAKAQYLAAVVQFEAANGAYNLEKERYELGLSAFFEFSQASNALIQGQAAKAQAEFTLMFQETILNYQIGQLKLDGAK